MLSFPKFRNVVLNYKNTIHTPEALYRLVECSLIIGIKSEAIKYAEVLKNSYQGNKWTVRLNKFDI